MKNNESNTLKSDKTTIIQHNLEVLSDIINENIDISFRIQIYQNMNSNLIDQVITRYSDI